MSAETDIIGLAELINFRVGAWHDFGYEQPPTPECVPIPAPWDSAAPARLRAATPQSARSTS